MAAQGDDCYFYYYSTCAKVKSSVCLFSSYLISCRDEATIPEIS